MAKTPSGSLSSLLAWYEQVKRPLPWRQDRDAYRVWVSEVMLQQTRVETAIPYYERFLSALPTVEALARAEDDEVQALWSGLGYYRRARMLVKAARDVVRNGGFPQSAEAWQQLPGVGPYTAAAVASIVHGERVVALDGNVERVLARLEAYDGRPKSAAGRRFLTQAAEPWIDADRPGDSNQALMELGATICLPGNPRCHRCPINRSCTARRRGRVEDYPNRSRAIQKEERRLLAVMVRRRDRFLLFRRDSRTAILPGTWELPWVESDDPDPSEELAERYGGAWRVGARIASIRHTITRRNLVVTVSEGGLECASSVAEGREARWANLTELDELPHSSLVRKAILAAAD
ncbi:MAG: A/G-specific adenine glycosylase [bacterium]|nr:A/G-specific adenine glycosylase [bacterium]